MATYHELMSQKAALDKQASALAEQIDQARRSEHAAVVGQIKGLMQEHGVSLSDLGAGGKPGRRPRGEKAVSSGRKVAAKYRDESNGNAWSGRGLQPNWLKAALKSGRKIEDFAV